MNKHKVTFPTVEEIVQAYEETGLTPRQRLTLRNGCACALGAYYEKKFDIRRKGVNVDIIHVAMGEFGQDFVRGVICGFDGDSEQSCQLVLKIEDFRLGYELGKSVWEKVGVRKESD